MFLEVPFWDKLVAMLARHVAKGKERLDCCRFLCLWIFVGPLRGKLPPLIVVATFQVVTVKSRPESLRIPLGEVARQLLTAGLEAEAKAPGVGAVDEWVLLHMFWKTVFDSAAEGDVLASVEVIRRRLARWRKREYLELWTECMGRSVRAQTERAARISSRKNSRKPTTEAACQ